MSLAPRLPSPSVAVPAGALAVALGYAASAAPLITVGAFGAAILGLLTLLQAEAMLLVLIAILPWEDLLLYPSATLSAVKIVGLLLGFAYVLRMLAGRAPLQATKTLVAVGVFGLLVALSLLTSTGLGTVGIAATLRYVLFAAFFFLLVQLAPDRPAVLRVLRVFVTSMALASLYGVVLFLREKVALASGPIANPNDFAFVVVVTLPLAGFLWVAEPRRRWWWTLCLLALVAGMLGALSRGALVGVAALALWGVLTRRIPVRGLVAATVVVVATAFVGLSFFTPVIEERLDSKGRIAQDNAQSRLAFWSAAAYMAADRPLTGYGPGSFGIVAPREYIRGNSQGIAQPVVHNSYLEVLAENGVPALLAFIAILGGSVLTVRRLRRRFLARGDVEGVRLAGALEGALVVAFAAGMFLSAAVIVSFWLVGGLIAALARDHRALEPLRAPA